MGRLWPETREPPLLLGKRESAARRNVNDRLIAQLGLVRRCPVDCTTKPTRDPPFGHCVDRIVTWPGQRPGSREDCPVPRTNIAKKGASALDAFLARDNPLNLLDWKANFRRWRWWQRRMEACTPRESARLTICQGILRPRGLCCDFALTHARSWFFLDMMNRETFARVVFCSTLFNNSIFCLIHSSMCFFRFTRMIVKLINLAVYLWFGIKYQWSLM